MSMNSHNFEFKINLEAETEMDTSKNVLRDKIFVEVSCMISKLIFISYLCKRSALHIAYTFTLYISYFINSIYL